MITAEDVQLALATIEQISQTNSTISKIFALRNASDNEVLKTLLERTYNPYRVYNIKNWLMATLSDTPNSMEENYMALLRLLDKLEKRELTGNAAIDAVVNFIYGCSDQEAKWYSRVIKKDLKFGMKAKSINEAIPDLIPEFNCMLAHKFRAYPNKMILQPKFDGMRCLVDTDTGKMFSRKGKELFGFEAIAEEVMYYLPRGKMLDGEIMVGDQFRQLMRQAFAKMDGKDGILNAFDLIPKDEFFKGQSSQTQAERTNLLNEYLHPVADKLTNIVPVESSTILLGSDPNIKSYVDDYFHKCRALGLEGTIVKDAEAPYVGKRSYSWQKLKPFETADLKVVDLQEGRPGTKYEGMLGALIVDYNGTKVGVGSGISDFERDLWWKDPSLILGKIVEVEFHHVTDNLKGTKSLREPRYIRVRNDKSAGTNTPLII